jgi:ABC-type dipeptide/oligopeptide/nickel transport system permease subunit
VAITFTVLAVNLIGDGLRDALGREVFVVKETA